MAKKKIKRKLNNDGNLFADGGKVGAVAGAVTDIAKTGLSNAQIADTSGIESEIDKARSYVVQANDNDALMSEWDAFTPMKSIDWRDIRGGSTGQRIGNTIGATASGASSGFTVGGPVGAVVGGVIGLGSAIGGWFGGNRKAKNKASSLNKQINIANSRNLLALSNRADTIDTQNDFTKLANYSAYGGPITMRYTGVMSPFGNTFGDGGELHTHGGDFTNGLTYIDNGGSHEANPFEGVQMGIDPQGVPNLVEEGEVIFNDYVFSNRLKVPKAIRQKYKLRDNITFADAAKKLSKESEDRPNDPISKRGLETFMSALANSQEEVRINNEDRRMNRYAKGGKLGNLFSGKEDHPSVLKGLEFPYLEPTAGDIPVLEGLSIEGLKPLDILDIPEKRKSKNSYLRYAPIAASGIAVLNDMLGGNEPNYTNADIFAKAIRDSYRPVSTRPIGEYLPYKPFDRMFYINQLNKNSAANRRAIQNTSGGNRAAALASLLASDYNYSENLGKLGRQAEEYNQALKEKVTDFNRRTNMYNSEQGTKVDMFNSELKAKQASLYGQLAGMRQSILNSNMEEKRENITNFIQGLGDLGREMEQKQWRKALYNTGYFGKSKELEQLLGII